MTEDLEHNETVVYHRWYCLPRNHLDIFLQKDICSWSSSCRLMYPALISCSMCQIRCWSHCALCTVVFAWCDCFPVSSLRVLPISAARDLFIVWHILYYICTFTGEACCLLGTGTYHGLFNWDWVKARIVFITDRMDISSLSDENRQQSQICEPQWKSKHHVACIKGLFVQNDVSLDYYYWYIRGVQWIMCKMEWDVSIFMCTP